MKLQLKRSNQVTGLPGSEVALPPTEANTEFGEISINYNEYDPALFCKLDNGDIVRIGGSTDDYVMTSSGTATTGEIVLTHNPIGTKASTTDTISITGGTGVTVDGSTGNTINISIDGGSDIGVDLGYTATASNGVVSNTAGDGFTIDAALGGVRAGLISSADQLKLDRVDLSPGQTTDERYVQKAGDSMTGNLELGTNVDIVFEGSTANNFETTLTVVDPTADITLALPNVSGTIVSTGDTGSVSSAMITNLTIVDGDISNSADITVSKLREGTANQVLVTNSEGNAVNWADQLNLSGDVTASGFSSSGNLLLTGQIIAASSEFQVAAGTGNTSIGGTLTVTDQATFSGGISADGGAFSVSNDTGNVSTTGSLDVSGLASLDGGIDVDGAFTVSDITGNISTTGSLTVSQLATFNGGISADGAFSVADVTGNVSTTGSLTVSQLATFNGGISADGAFSVANDTGNVSTTGSLDVSGLASLDGGIDVDGAFTVSDTTGNISTTGSLTVSSSATFNGGISADGAFSVADVTGNVSTTGSLDVSGLASLDGGIDVDGAFTVSDTTGNISTTGTLGVSGLISANGKISFPLGSQSTPSIYPGTDSDTGIYSPAADTFAITTSGVERARFSATGNFGINATNPLSLLQVGQARFEVTGLTAERIYTYPDAAGTVALTSSNVATASAWANSRTITLGGDTTGSVSIDGSSNVTLDITVADDSHNHTISNVDNLQTTLDAKADLVSGVIPTSQLPALAVTEFLGTVSSQTAMLALSGQKGDWCNRTDVSSTFIITGTDPTQLSNWTELDYPAADVTSVNTQTGAVVLSASDIGLGNVDNTSDLNKPISSATQTALNGKLGSTANAASASQWNTARTITLGGDLSGSVSIDGSSNVTLNGQVADDSHNHIIANVDGLQAALDAKLGHSGTASDSELLDGLNSTSFLRSDADTTKTSGHLLFNDNRPIRFGTGADAQMFHNGSDMYFDFEVAGDTWYFRDSSDSAIFGFAEPSGNLSLYKGSVLVGDGGDQSTVQIKKADNNVADHIQFYNGTTRMGEIGCQDTTWLRINQSTNKNIYTPRYILADGGLFVDSAGYGINGTGVLVSNTGATIGGNTAWHAGNDGAGSGLDADLLDGVQGSSYLRSNSTDTYSGGTLLVQSHGQSGSYQGWGLYYDSGWKHTNANSWGYYFRNEGGGLKISVAREAGTATGAATTNDYFFDSTTDESIRIAHTNSQQGYAQQHNINAPFYNTFSQTGSQYQAIIKGRSTGSGQTFIGSLGILHYTNGDHNLALHSILSNGTDSRSYHISGSSGGIWTSGNDGAGSGLDADLLDGAQPSVSASGGTIVQRHASGYIYANYFNTSPNDVTSGVTRICCETGNDGFIRHATADAVRGFIGAGSGNGLDADLLDGVQGSSYLRSDAGEQYDGQVSGRIFRFRCPDGRNAGSSSGSLFPLEIYQNSNVANSDAAIAFHIGGRYATYFGLDRETNDLFTGGWSDGTAKHKIWHAGNDGSGSGLDADLLDGQNLQAGAATANTVVGRNGSGDIHCRLLRPTYGNQTTISGAMAFRVNNSSDNYVRFCSDQGAIRTFLGTAPSASPTFTGNLTIPGSIVHTGDTDTYIQFHGNDLFRVVIAGAEVQEWGNNYTLLSDNDQLRLGTGSDFRMWFNGADTYFRNYAHADGDIIFQGENSGGTNQNLLIMKTDGARTYNILYENSQERFRTTSGGVTVTGALTATGDVTAFSDIKLKEDIKVIPNALEKVSKIRGVTFIRNDVDDKSRQAGVIAQEVEKVLPEVVTTTEDGIKTVAYGNLVGLLIESIKELKKEVEELKGASN